MGLFYGSQKIQNIFTPFGKLFKISKVLLVKLNFGKSVGRTENCKLNQSRLFRRDLGAIPRPLGRFLFGACPEVQYLLVQTRYPKLAFWLTFYLFHYILHHLYLYLLDVQ
jgi:hypothetical protein